MVKADSRSVAYFTGVRAATVMPEMQRSLPAGAFQEYVPGADCGANLGKWVRRNRVTLKGLAVHRLLRASATVDRSGASDIDGLCRTIVLAINSDESGGLLGYQIHFAHLLRGACAIFGAHVVDLCCLKYDVRLESTLLPMRSSSGGKYRLLRLVAWGNVG
jgi:hypothetical protein